MFISRCSINGPNDSAGKKVKPPIINITDIRRPIKRKLSVRNVPDDTGVIFLRDRLPEIARTGMIMPNRPASIAIPRVRL